MIIKHNVSFVTTIDEDKIPPTMLIKLKSMVKNEREEFFASMLKSIIIDQEWLDKLNENNTYAVLALDLDNDVR